jgi:disulfide bond formation protein DsbB
MKCFYDRRYLFLFFCAISTGILAATFAMEYVFNIPPCNLCLLERIPYGVASLLGLCGFFYSSRVFLWGTLFIFLGSLILSTYHLAVVYHWIEIPILCIKPFFKSVEEMLASDMIVPCDRSPFNVLGAPLAFWNLVVSVGLGGLCGWALMRHE